MFLTDCQARNLRPATLTYYRQELTRFLAHSTETGGKTLENITPCMHCDPTASHYLKIVLDAIFGPENFRNEITWRRTNTHNDAVKKFPDVADIILFYVKSNRAGFNPQYTAHDEQYIAKFYRFDAKDGRGLYTLDNMTSPNPRPTMMCELKGFPYPARGWRYHRETTARLDEEGHIYYPRDKSGNYDYTKRPRLKRYLNEQKGVVIGNVWNDIPPIQAQAAERMGYPTQKPVALLERIISALHFLAAICAIFALALFLYPIVTSLHNLRDGLSTLITVGIIGKIAPVAIALAVIQLCLAFAYDMADRDLD